MASTTTPKNEQQKPTNVGDVVMGAIKNGAIGYGRGFVNSATSGNSLLNHAFLKGYDFLTGADAREKKNNPIAQVGAKVDQSNVYLKKIDATTDASLKMQRITLADINTNGLRSNTLGEKIVDIGNENLNANKRTSEEAKKTREETEVAREEAEERANEKKQRDDSNANTANKDGKGGGLGTVAEIAEGVVGGEAGAWLLKALGGGMKGMLAGLAGFMLDPVVLVPLVAVGAAIWGYWKLKGMTDSNGVPYLSDHPIDDAVDSWKEKSGIQRAEDYHKFSRKSNFIAPLPTDEQATMLSMARQNESSNKYDAHNPNDTNGSDVGAYQFNVKGGVADDFLKEKGYKLRSTDPDFYTKWSELLAQNPAKFAKDQDDYEVEHYGQKSRTMFKNKLGFAPGPITSAEIMGAYGQGQQSTGIILDAMKDLSLDPNNDALNAETFQNIKKDYFDQGKIFKLIQNGDYKKQELARLDREKNQVDKLIAALRNQPKVVAIKGGNTVGSTTNTNTTHVYQVVKPDNAVDIAVGKSQQAGAN